MNEDAIVFRSTKRSVGRSLLSSGIGPLLAQGLTIALLPVLYRLYRPEDFGVWATIQALALVAGALVSLRFDLALVIEKEAASAAQLLIAILAVVLLCSLAIGLLLVLAFGWLRVLDIDGPATVLGWIWLLAVGVGVALQGWMMRDAAFGLISMSVVLNALTTNLVQIVGGFSRQGVWLIIGSLAGQLAAILLLGWYVWKQGGLRGVRPDPHVMWAALKQHRRFPQLSLPFTVLSLVRERAPIFIIGAFFSASVVGLYSQAWRLTHFPSGFTSAAFRPVFFHRTVAEGLSAQGSIIERLVRALLIICSGWVGVVIFGYNDLFTLGLGSKWNGAGVFAAMLLVPATFFMISNWMDRLLDAVGRQDLNLKMEMVAGLTSTGLLWGTLAAGGGVTLAVLLQSIALTGSYLAFLWICYGVAGWSRGNLVASVCVASSISAAMYMAMMGLSQLFPHLAVLAIGIAVSAGVTGAMIMTIRRHLA